MNRLVFFYFSVVVLVTLSGCSIIRAQITPVAAPAAPSGSPNITRILEEAGNFTIFLELLRTTQVGNQINAELNNSNNGTTGMTVFAPSDSAFSVTPGGSLDSLTDEQKAELVKFHVIHSFLSISLFQTVSNPVRTQAGVTRVGQYQYDIITSGNEVYIYTSTAAATVEDSIYTSDDQLAVYQVDKVLVSLSIFDPQAVQECFSE